MLDERCCLLLVMDDDNRKDLERLLSGSTDLCRMAVWSDSGLLFLLLPRM